MPDAASQRRDARNDAGRNAYAASGTGAAAGGHHHAALRAAAVPVAESLRIVHRLAVTFAKGQAEHAVTITVTGRLPERIQISGELGSNAISITDPLKTPLS